MAEWVTIPEDDERRKNDTAWAVLDCDVRIDCPCGERVEIVRQSESHRPFACSCGRVYRVRACYVVEEHV